MRTNRTDKTCRHRVATTLALFMTAAVATMPLAPCAALANTVVMEEVDDFASFGTAAAAIDTSFILESSFATTFEAASGVEVALNYNVNQDYIVQNVDVLAETVDTPLAEEATYSSDPNAFIVSFDNDSLIKEEHDKTKSTDDLFQEILAAHKDAAKQKSFQDIDSMFGRSNSHWTPDSYRFGLLHF